MLFISSRVVHSLKQLLLTFEKKAAKNQQMRLKHYDEPQKFMESEIELNACIQDLSVVAASPELYPIIVEQNSVRSIVGLISHENTDISLAVIGLLDEMLDASALADVPEAAPFVRRFLSEQGLALVVQNLTRLNEAESDEEAQGVTSSLSIVESLLELAPEVADSVCHDTGILQYLISRVRAKSFDANQLHASEVLSMLLQASESTARRLVALKEIDGLDELLQAIAPYRKRNPESLDEAVSL